MESTEAIRRRGLDRRRSSRFVVSERRSGFERRRRQRSSVATAYDGALVFLRDNPAALAALLALANLLSVFDLLFTRSLLRLGVTEANPFMRYLLEADPARAALVKVGLVALASLVIWLLRRYRSVLQLALFLVAVYAAVVLYECAGIVHLL